MAERANLSEAADMLSARIRDEGGGLQPEFEYDEPAETSEDGAGHPDPETGKGEEGLEAEAPETEADSDERFAMPNTVAELAEMLGVEMSDLYGLKFSVDMDDGQSQMFTLSSLKDAATRPLRDEAEQARYLDARRSQEAELQAQKQALDDRRREADTLASVVYGRLNTDEQQAAQEYQALLRNIEFQGRDPQGYHVQLMRIQAKLDDVRAQKQGLAQQMQQVRQKMDAELNEAVEKRRQEGARRLRQYIPEWTDENVFAEGASALRSYVMQERFGTTEAELDATMDARVFYWAEMARRYEALQEKAKEKPKARPIAALRPGAPAVRLPNGRRAEMEAMDRLKGSGSIDDARSVLANRLKQSG